MKKEKEIINALRKELREAKINEEIHVEMLNQIHLQFNEVKDKATEIVEECRILRNKEKELFSIKDKLINEYFLNTELERKRLSSQIDIDSTKNQLTIETISLLSPVIKLGIKMFKDDLFPKEQTSQPQNFCNEVNKIETKK